MLTDEQINLLAQPFPPEDHRFVSGAPFLPKAAIMQRLSQVDPAWTLSAPTLVHQDDDIVVLSANLTVCGITRPGLGTGVILRTKQDKTTKEIITFEGFELLKSISKAWKTAATDTLARAAVAFGVGGYLRDLPDSAKKSKETYLDHFAKLANGWRYNGGRQRLKDLLNQTGLDWPTVAALVEPGRVLSTLADTTLTESELHDRVKLIAATLAAAGKTAS